LDIHLLTHIGDRPTLTITDGPPYKKFKKKQ
jgi:hypothetical protein